MTSDLTDIRDRASSILAWRQMHLDGDMAANRALDHAADDAQGILVLCNEAMARKSVVLVQCIIALTQVEKTLSYCVAKKDFAKWIDRDGHTQDPYGVHANLAMVRAALAIAEGGG